MIRKNAICCLGLCLVYSLFYTLPLAASVYEEITISNKDFSSESDITLNSKGKIIVDTVTNVGSLKLAAAEQIHFTGETLLRGSVHAYINPNLNSIDSYPKDGATLSGEQGDTFFLLFIAGEFDESTIKVVDQNGVEYKNFTFKNGVLYVDISGLESGDYHFIVYQNGQPIEERSITVDAIAPITNITPPNQDRFEGTLSVSFTVTDNSTSTLYYSSDGLPPMKGALNTTEVQFPAHEGHVHTLQITDAKKFIYYSVDLAGNREEMKSKIFLVDPKITMTDVALILDNNGKPQLSWNQVERAVKYRIYRSVGNFENSSLLDSQEYSLSAPADLLISEQTVLTYLDAAVLPSLEVIYGVSAIDEKNNESPVVAKKITIEGVATQSADDAVKKAWIWLKSSQQSNGLWGKITTLVQPYSYLIPPPGSMQKPTAKRVVPHHKRSDIVDASQVLDAAYFVQKKFAFGKDLLFYGALAGLLGENPTNNYTLMRKINSLWLFYEDTENLEARLYLERLKGLDGRIAYSSHSGFRSSPLEMILCGSSIQLSNIYSGFYNESSYLYRWTEEGSDSFYASAMVVAGSYMNKWEGITSIDYGIYQYNRFSRHQNEWDSNEISQLSPVRTALMSQYSSTNGFGDSVLKTAAAMKWLNLDTSTKNNSIFYLLGRQLPNGSWDNNVFITALCMEVLAR